MARTRISKKFDRCVKSVRKTVKARKGSNKESAAIAICTTTLLHPRGRTLKRYRKGKLVTQKKRKMRGGIWNPLAKTSSVKGVQINAELAAHYVPATQVVEAIEETFKNAKTVVQTIDVTGVSDYANGLKLLMAITGQGTDYEEAFEVVYGLEENGGIVNLEDTIPVGAGGGEYSSDTFRDAVPQLRRAIDSYDYTKSVVKPSK